VAEALWPGPAGSPARQRGNFLLRGQKKVTKEEALNRTRAPHARAAPCNSRTARGKTRPAALSLLSLSPAPAIATPARLTSAARRTHEQSQYSVARATRLPVGWGELREPQRSTHRPASGFAPQPTRRPSDAAFGLLVSTACSRALTGVKGRWMVLVTGTAARAKRFASGRNAGGRFRAPLLAAPRSCAVQRLFFGDFLLAPQKKVTPPPGGTPGTTLTNKPEHRRTT
jgi:hypothetical protein